MKKIISILLLLAMTMSLFAVSGCSEDNNTDIRIGIAAPAVTHGWVAGAAYYAEKYCKENNITYKLVTSKDGAEMSAQLQDLAAWGATAIVCFPQWTGMETAMQEIVESGIKVVNFDVDVPCEGVYKVTGDNYDMGYQSAKYIVEKAGAAANIVVMDVPSSGSVCELRKQGFYDYLTEIGYDQSNITEMQLPSFTRTDGLTAMADALAKYSTIDAIYSMDDETSMGCIQAITDAGRTDIKAITGGGGCQEYFNMINDEQYASLGLASALYSPAMIQDAVRVAITLLEGGEAEAQTVIKTTIVTKDNVSEHLDPENNVY